MSLEKKLLQTISSSKEYYNKLSALLQNTPFTFIGQKVFKEIDDFYKTDPSAPKVDDDVLMERLSKKYEKDWELILEYLSQWPVPESVPNVIKIYEDYYKERLGVDIASSLMGNNEAHAKQLMETYLTLNVEDKVDEVFNATPIEELEQHVTGNNLIPIYPSKLNDYLGGGVPRQSHICVFARPDVGKSTVAINIAGKAAQLGYRVLYIGNEDPAPKMVFRIVARLTKTPESIIRKDPAQYYKLAMENGYENVFFVPMHPGTIPEVRQRIEKVEPDLVIIDQIRNLHVKPDSMTVNLEQASIATRNLAKEFNLVMTVVTQAGNSAANKAVLDMEDVEWSNTGLPGQMDLMIGVGQSHEMKQMNQIVLSFPKNKFTAPIKPFHAAIDYSTQVITA